jgi:hypothetical protein
MAEILDTSRPNKTVAADEMGSNSFVRAYLPGKSVRTCGALRSLIG